MQWWQVAAGANTVVALACLGTSAAIALRLLEARQLRSNRLGAAAALVLVSLAVGHGLHAVHLLSPGVGLHVSHGEVARTAVDGHLALWEAATACVGVWCWTLRRSYGRLLLGGATPVEDHRSRRREAAEINDAVVQGIVTAQLARRLGRDDESDAALQGTLVAARDLVSRLLDEASGGRPLDAGDFVRADAARVGVGVPAPRGSGPGTS